MQGRGGRRAVRGVVAHSTLVVWNNSRIWGSFDKAMGDICDGDCVEGVVCLM